MKYSTSHKAWSRTLAGVVVYKKQKQYWNVKSVQRIINTLTPEEKAKLELKETNKASFLIWLARLAKTLFMYFPTADLLNFLGVLNLHTPEGDIDIQPFNSIIEALTEFYKLLE